MIFSRSLATSEDASFAITAVQLLLNVRYSPLVKVVLLDVANYLKFGAGNLLVARTGQRDLVHATRATKLRRIERP
jgi:hypothetical protein